MDPSRPASRDVVDGPSAQAAEVPDHWSQLMATEAVPIDATRRPDPAMDSGEAAELMAQLPRISLSPAAHPEAPTMDLITKEVLGEGGMGVVTLCRQRSLGRDVAVKTVRGSAPSPTALRSLLQEARITGALEHPGIVPVHELGVHPDGRPLLVMKRVTGVVWRTMLYAPEHPAWERVRGDRLSYHLEVLRKVCDAVHFAHSRGVVHRDLKTSNVMLGEFGEVYVLDWGIACETGDPESAAQNIGTPGFMAPEMISGGALPITPRTDVYLLGGMLHEVLMGTVRHRGATIHEVLLNVFRSEPVAYPPSVPAELAALCNLATQGLASERPSDARAFSEAILAYTEHRASDQLAQAARERLVALRALTPGADHATAQRLWTEANFGFQKALAAWHLTPNAESDLREATEWMVRHELARRDVDAAGLLLATLDPQPPALVDAHARLRDELADEAREMATLRGMARELDTRVAAPARSRAAVGAAVGAAMIPLAMLWMQHRGWIALTHATVAEALAAVLTFAAAATWRGRQEFMKNQAARRMAALPFVALLGALASLGVGAWQGLSLHASVVSALLVISAVFAATGVSFHPKILLVAALTFAAALACAALPLHVFEVIAVCGLCASGAMALLFRSGSARDAA